MCGYFGALCKYQAKKLLQIQAERYREVCLSFGAPVGLWWAWSSGGPLYMTRFEVVGELSLSSHSQPKQTRCPPHAVAKVETMYVNTDAIKPGRI